MDARKIFLALFGLLTLILVATVVFVVVSIRQTAAEMMAPFHNANANLQTQVAQLLHPTPTIIPDPISIVHEVRSLARLETIQYTVEKVITAETGQGDFAFLFGDKLLLVAHGYVIAGVDLEKLAPQDLSVEGSILRVRLPYAEVFSAVLENEKSYVYDRETGLLTKGDYTLETNARRAAEKEILRTAIDDGILDQAMQNAENYLSRFLRSLGYQDVIFLPSAATPTPAE